MGFGGAGSAIAAPGDTITISGTAKASVADPARLQKLQDLRFGDIMQPTTAGMVEIDAAGGIVANIDISTFPLNRGPSRFLVRGDPNRKFLVFLPNRIDISNGTATMQVDRFRMNAVNGNVRLNALGLYDLVVGGRLQVAALQQPGRYSGTFAVTVVYQ